MATATNVSYNAATGNDIFAGRAENSADALAATLSSGVDAELTTTGLDVADGGGRYPVEGAVNDLLIDWCVTGFYNYHLDLGGVAGAPNGTAGTDGTTSGIPLFDMQANDWSVVRNFSSLSAVHCYANTVVDARTNIMYKGISFGAGVYIVQYDLNTNTALSDIPYAPVGRVSISSFVILPNRGTKGYLYDINGNGKIYRLDLDRDKHLPVLTTDWVLVTDTLSDLNQADTFPAAHYNPVSNKIICLVVGGGAPLSPQPQAYVIDGTTDAVTRTTGTHPEIELNTTNFIPVPNSVESLCICNEVTDGNGIVPLNTDTEVWGTHEALPTNIAAQPNVMTDTLFIPVLEKGYIASVTYALSGASQTIVYKR